MSNTTIPEYTPTRIRVDLAKLIDKRAKPQKRSRVAELELILEDVLQPSK